MFENVMNRYYWGGIEDSSVYLDENNRRMLTNFRSTFNRLAETLVAEGRIDSARMVLDRSVEKIPDRVAPFGYFTLPVIESYYKIGEMEKARDIARQLEKRISQELDYIFLLTPQQRTLLSNTIQLDLYVYRRMVNLAQNYDETVDHSAWLKKLSDYLSVYQQL